MQIDASVVGFDLTFGQADFRRVRRPRVPGADRLDGADLPGSPGSSAGQHGPDGSVEEPPEDPFAGSEHPTDLPATEGALQGPDGQPEERVVA